jgi:hypothetical protein
MEVRLKRSLSRSMDYPQNDHRVRSDPVNDYVRHGRQDQFTSPRGSARPSAHGKALQRQRRVIKACELSKLPDTDVSQAGIRSKIQDRWLPLATIEPASTAQHAFDPARHLFFLDKFAALNLVDPHLRLLPKPLVFCEQLIDRLSDKFICATTRLRRYFGEFGDLMGKQFDIHKMSLVPSFPCA